jgi:hypothetical protein
MINGVAALYQISIRPKLHTGKCLTQVYESTYNPEASQNRSPELKIRLRDIRCAMRMN